jgi:alpha-glucosidase
MRAMRVLAVWWWGCGASEREVGGYTVELLEDGRLTVTAPGGQRLEELQLWSGTGEASVEMQFGAFWFSEVTRELASPTILGRLPREEDGVLYVPLEEGQGELTLRVLGEDRLAIDFVPAQAHDRVGFSAACAPDDRFLGAGSHAMDLDHRGEAFALWTSEPGIGKSATDDKPAAWPIEGTKHATSFPVPWLLRPGRADGLLLDTGRRVELDLCATDESRFEMVAWDEAEMHLVWITGAEPLQVVRSLTDHLGRAPLPPPWVFGPWADAIRGPERVRAVRDTLLGNEIPATLIWSEDWKGAQDTPTGYRLGEEWFVDRTKYPDPEGLAAELEADGLRWLVYFAPFLGEGTVTYEEALAADVLVKDEAGEPYLFTGVTLTPTGLLDLSTEAGRSFAVQRMQDALALGFDGWMADYGEWLPADAVMANGMTGLEAHALYPQWWQETNLAAQQGWDATFFVRSGWTRTAGLVPVVWAGDQRTSFDADDGYPTVLPLALGLSASGVGVFTHDVAGYQSVGNPPSDRELWFRWAWLGAFSPIQRLHHGSFDTQNHQFDSDPETLAHYGVTAREHARLFPYRYGLAARASRDGTPMILPLSFVFDGEDPARMDAWMLGEGLLVAPVLEQGATGREVRLPEGVRFWDWFTLQPAHSGYVEASVEEIPVFAAEHTTVPTLGEGDDRVVYLFGGGGPFEEADGTRYSPQGQPTGPGEIEVVLQSGEVEVAGVTIAVEGPALRSYRFILP